MVGDRLGFIGRIINRMVRKRPANDEINFKGRFVMEHWRDGKLIGTYPIDNTVVNVGKNDNLNTYFHSGSQIATSSWCISLINLTSYSGISAADTMGSHAGWTEFTSYSEGTRVAWGQDSAASQQITNSTPATFTISGSGTVKGIFVTSQNTKGGTTGILWSAGLFPGGDVPVSSSDELKITYTLSC